MCSALQTVHNDGGWGGKKLNCNRIDLFKYNNTALQRSEEETQAPRQRLTGSMKPQAVIDKLLEMCKPQIYKKKCYLITAAARLFKNKRQTENISKN